MCFFRRLYFTTFAGIAPNQQALNASISGPHDNPPLRRQMATSNDTAPSKYYFFTIDHSLNYESFYEDWGPLNLANVFRTLILIHELLQVRLPHVSQPRCLNARATEQGDCNPQTRALFIQ
jgi:cell division cycle 14